MITVLPPLLFFPLLIPIEILNKEVGVPNKNIMYFVPTLKLASLKHWDHQMNHTIICYILLKRVSDFLQITMAHLTRVVSITCQVTNLTHI